MGETNPRDRLVESAISCHVPPMPLYLYETVPAQPDDAPERFQLRQAMHEPALTTHPETGVPVRRVISGGMGFVSRGAGATETAAMAARGRRAAAAAGAACGPDCACF